jgi:DNA-binding response OmpR family regulator
MSIVLVGPKGGAAWALSPAFGQQNAPSICVADVQAALGALGRTKVAALVLDPFLCHPKTMDALREARAAWPACAIFWCGPLPEAPPDNGPLFAFQLGALDTPAAQARAVGVVVRFVRKRSDAVCVLVVDDMRTYRALGQSALEKGGFPTMAAASMEEAIATMQHVRVGAMLTDLFMEGMGGIAGIHHLGKERPDLAIGAMSSGLEERMAALKIGADQAVSKPFQPEALIDAMRAAIIDAKARAGAGCL